MASVQELLLAAQAKQPKSPLSALADLITAGTSGYASGLQDRNLQSETDLRRATLAKTLLEAQAAEEQRKNAEAIRPLLQQQIGTTTEQDLRTKQANVGTPPTPTTPAEKLQREISIDSEGKMSVKFKPKEVKQPTSIEEGLMNEVNSGRMTLDEAIAKKKQAASSGSEEKDQNKLYHQSVTNLRQFFGSRSGNFGTQDAKVNQAVHLGNLADQYYNPATGTHDIPEAQSSELVMGLANLISNSNVTTVEGLRSITPKNFQSDTAHIVAYWTGKPVTYQPEEMTRNLLDSIDRQGTVAEDLRNTYLQQGKDAFVEPGLNESNTKRLLGIKVGSSYRDYLATRPSAQKPDTGGAGRISVIRLSDNQPGTINESDFDPAKYRRK